MTENRQKAILLAQVLPAFAHTLEALLERGLPPCPVLALGWTLGHGAEIAALPPALRPAGALASRALCVERFCRLPTGDLWLIRAHLRNDRAALANERSLLPLLRRCALPLTAPPPGLGDLARAIAAAGIADPADAPPADPPPPLLAGKPGSLPEPSTLLEGHAAAVDAVAFPDDASIPAFFAQARARLETRPVLAIAQAGIFLEAEPDRISAQPIAEILAYVEAVNAMTPDRQAPDPDDAAPASALDTEALARLLRRSLPAGLQIAVADDRRSGAVHLHLPGAGDARPLLHAIPTTAALADGLFIDLRRRPGLEGCSDALDGILPPALPARAAIPPLAAVRGAAAWLEDGEIRLVADPAAPPIVPPVAAFEVFGAGGRMSERAFDALGRLAAAVPDGTCQAIAIPTKASAHGRAALAETPPLARLERFFGGDTLRIRRQGNVAACAAGDIFLVLTPVVHAEGPDGAA